MAVSKIISAVGSAGGAPKEFAGAVQEALTKTIEKALAEGVTDPEEMRRRQDTARKKVVRAMEDAANQANMAGVVNKEDITRLMNAARDKVMHELGLF